MPTATFLPPPAQLPELASVDVVLREVLRQQSQARFRVGFCNAANLVAAAEHVGTLDELQELSRGLADLGYRALWVGGDREMAGCDVIYVRARSPAGAGA